MTVEKKAVLDQERDYFTSAEAALIAKCAPPTIRKFAANGLFPTYRVGGIIVIPRKSFLRWHNAYMMQKAWEKWGGGVIR